MKSSKPICRHCSIQSIFCWFGWFEKSTEIKQDNNRRDVLTFLYHVFLPEAFYQPHDFFVCIQCEVRAYQYTLFTEHALPTVVKSELGMKGLFFLIHNT